MAIGNALRMAKFELKNHSPEDVDPENSKVVVLYSSGNQNAGIDPITEANYLKENYQGEFKHRV